jgi:hypothetical protein
VLKTANPNANFCNKRALAARERALEKKYPADRIFYFEAEARWLKLVERYEFSTRAKRLIANHRSSPQRPSCPACAITMPLAEIQVIRGAVDHRYECKECGYNMRITVCED